MVRQVISPHKCQWRGALMFSLICVWINGWVNNGEAGDLRCYRAHYDVIVILFVLHDTGFTKCTDCWIPTTVFMMQECIFMFREIKHLTLNICKNSTFHKKKNKLLNNKKRNTVKSSHLTLNNHIQRNCICQDTFKTSSFMILVPVFPLNHIQHFLSKFKHTHACDIYHKYF